MKFFRKRQNAGGFTLVELVVVIAVLAILAGVGAVAYNGYIEYAHKGADRKTVGEIEHALELANYENPALFEHGATVWISKNGAVCSSDGVKQALIDVFGEDLSTVTLTSDSWDLAPPNIEGLTDSGTDVKAYLDYAQEHGKASFADDIFGLWDTVVQAKASFGGTRDNYLDLAIQYADKYKEDGTDSPAIKNWLEGNAIEDMGAEAGQAVALARNYCFAIWASTQDLTSTQRDQLQAFINDNYGNYGMYGLKTKFFYDNYVNNDASREFWEGMVTQYTEAKGKSDVLAYLGLMEAAGKVGTSEMKDDEFMSTMNKYLGTVNAYFTDPNTAELVENIEGDCATVTAIQLPNGSLRFVTVPDDLNPREEQDNTSSDEPGDGSTCGYGEHSTGTVNLTFAKSGTKWTTSESVILCSKDSNYNNCNITTSSVNLNTNWNIESYSVSNLVEFDPATGILKVTGTTSEPTQVKIILSNGSGNFKSTLEFTVTVH